MLRRLLSLLLVISFTFSSCSTIQFSGQRTIASYSQEEVSRLQYLLAVDKFHYYLTELVEFKKGKVSDELVSALYALTPDRIMELDLTYEDLNNPKQYDLVVHKALSQSSPALNPSKADVEWGYNFFKNKLSDSYVIDAFDNGDDIGSPKIGVAEKKAQELEPKIMKVEEQTLEAEHYISNRTTRGIFWEAADSGRAMEFHLSDPREFKQNVGFRGGEIIGEVKTISSNYNKIFIVQYPGEDTFRYAITNVGGVDRMEHLISSLSLSKSGITTLKNKIEVYGDIEAFHKSIQRRLENMLGSLPKADRLIIGQKSGIETFFYTYWKVLALKNIYDNKPELLDGVASAKDQEKLNTLIKDPSQFDLGKHKGIVDKSFAKIKKEVEQDYPDFLPKRFKQFDFDNFLASISDLEFSDSNGKPVRWRLISNVWGDEIYPIASALKNTGHDKVVYSGTAGALPNRGLTVGDMVIPGSLKTDEASEMIGQAEFNVEGSKHGKVLGHVGSPFDETNVWLNKSLQQGIDLVEVEGKYLTQVFGADNVSLYLMVSDVISSDGETLAHASSSKRKAMLQSFIHTMADIDSGGLIKEASSAPNELQTIRAIVEEAIGGKGDVFKHLLISRYLDEGYIPTLQDVLKDADEIPTFSDNYFHTRLSEPSSVMTKVFAAIEGDKPDLAISRNFLEGNFNPKTDKLEVRLVAIGEHQRANIEAALQQFNSELDDLSDLFDLKVVDEIGADEKFVQIEAPKSVDSDVFFKMYSHFALKKTGLDYSVTNSANVTFKFLPTEVTENVCDISAKNFCATAYFSPGKKVRELAQSFRNLFKNTAFKSKFDQYISMANNGSLYGFSKTSGMKYTVKKEIVNSLPNGSLGQIIPEFDAKDGLVIKVQFTKEGWERPEVVLEEYGHLKQIFGESSKELFHDPFHWAALSLNAQQGSNRSKEVLAEAESDVLSIIKGLSQELSVNSSAVDTYLEARQVEVDALQKSIDKELRAENKARRSMAKNWRSVQSALEKESLKLDDYIAANNRKKVVELISTYLPWEEMEPTEINAWRNWLDTMERPNADYSANEKIVLFRGLADDLVRDSDDGGHFLMSSMLTKNQGNYSRRLRSLKTYRDKLADQAQGYPFKVTSIINSLKGHSVNPVGSPFISLSYADKASAFSGTEKNMAVLSVPRERLIDNLISGFSSEREQMVPLILFPDEILTIESGVNNRELESIAAQKMGRALTSYEKGSPAVLDPLEATKNYWDFISRASHNAPKGGSCDKVLKEIFELD
ncbi:MAG: hypothetical protein CME60_14550 [Halobacteriovoraceae bacterium]|nr:hypothetical protein [Halobacteriovoraceae bacterium]